MVDGNLAVSHVLKCVLAIGGMDESTSSVHVKVGEVGSLRHDVSPAVAKIYNIHSVPLTSQMRNRPMSKRWNSLNQCY